VRTFGYYHAGQDCTAACRIYAGPKIYEKVVAELTAAVSTIKAGLQDEDGVEIGPLISDRQRNRVASFVERAQMAGHMEVTTGGKERVGNGFFYEPTVIAGARQDDEMPHGGLKSSGYGKDMSMYALEDYTVARHIMARF